MGVRKILTINKHEKTLRSKSEPVHKVNREIKALCKDLIDTMAENPAIGLAAPQIGVLKRVFAVRLGYNEDEEEDDENQTPPLIMINPEIVQQDGTERGYDACLSIPGMMGYTDRATSLHIKYLDEQGQKQDRTFEGWDVRVIMHELDHLDGVLFTDRLNSLADLYIMVETEDGKREPVPYLEIVKGAEQKAVGTRTIRSTPPKTNRLI